MTTRNCLPGDLAALLMELSCLGHSVWWAGGETLDKPLVLWTFWAAELLSSHAGRQSFELDIWMLCKHHALVTQFGVVGRTKGVKELHLLVTLCKHM